MSGNLRKMQDENRNKVQPREGIKIANFTGKNHSNNNLNIQVQGESKGTEIGNFKGENHTENSVTVTVTSQSNRGSLEEELENRNEVQPRQGNKVANFSGEGHSKNKLNIQVQNESQDAEIANFEGEKHTENIVQVTAQQTMLEVIPRNTTDNVNKSTPMEVEYNFNYN